MPFFDPTQLASLNLDSFDPNAFMNELIDGADIDEASKVALQTVITKPVVTQRLKNGVALRRDAQSAMDRARNLANEAEQVRDANMAWADQNKRPLEAWLAQQRGNPYATVTTGAGEVLTKAEVAALLEEQNKKFMTMLASQDEAYVGLNADTLKLMQRWTRMFPDEDFPIDELQKHALAKRTTLSTAFDSYIAPKVEEQRKLEIEKIKREAFEAGRLDALSQREEPSAGEASGDMGSAFKDVLLGRRTQTLGTDGKPLEGEDAFVASWNRTRGFTQVNASSNTNH